MTSSIRLAAGAAAAVLLAASAASPAAAQGGGYVPAPAGSTQLTSDRTGLAMRVLVDSAAMGGPELAMVEMTLPAGEPLIAGEHRHGTIELFYVLEGELEHVVDGRSYRLGPGGVAVLRPGDPVRHRVLSDGPVRALVVWVPGSELERIRPGMATRALPGARTAAADAAGLSRLRQRWTDAYQGGDSAAMATLYTPDAVRMPYDATAEVGRDAVMAAYGASFRTRRLIPEIVLTPDQLRLTPTLAVERGSYHEVLTSRTGDVRIIEDGTYVSLIRPGSDGEWRYEWSMFNRDAPRP